MKSRIVSPEYNENIIYQQGSSDNENIIRYGIIPELNEQEPTPGKTTELAEILVITSYPPRECGIATYSQDLIKALDNKFSNSLSIKVCALESNGTTYPYPKKYNIFSRHHWPTEYKKLAFKINKDERIKIVLIQHEFGFYKEQEQVFLQFLYELSKPIVIVFHTVLPHPDEQLRSKIRSIAAVCESIIVMTHNSAGILTTDYGCATSKKYQ